MNNTVETSEAWYLGQSVLAIVNLQNAFAKIGASNLSSDEKHELRSMLAYLFESAHTKMIEGRDGNPVHHHTMVLDLMIEIALVEEIDDYVVIKNLAVLSLLHDIGYAETTAKKWTASEVESAVEKEPDPKKQKAIVEEAMQARDEHMRKGAGMVGSMLHDVNARYRKLVFAEEHIHAIGEAVAMHDRPSSAKLKEEYFPRSLSKDDLLPAENELAKFLRDADRLWMATAQGVKKYLISKGKPVTDENLTAKLDRNCKSFKKEKELYGDVYPEKAQLDEFGFIGGTLFRTSGYDIFKRLSNLSELKRQMGEPVRLAVNLKTCSVS